MQQSGKYQKLLDSLKLYNTYSWGGFIPIGALLHFYFDFSYVAGLWFGMNLMLLAMWGVVLLLNYLTQQEKT
jgi:uncharacterized membrane protein